MRNMVFFVRQRFFLVTIAYAMIIFIQCASSNFLKNMICVGMYIYVFIEDADENYAWETSLLIRDIKLYNFKYYYIHILNYKYDKKPIKFPYNRNV